MTPALLVLLASDLLGPFQTEFERVARENESTPMEVQVGTEAPPGRDVAWVAPLNGTELELVLHTARIPGDLRRVLRFAEEDAPRERARAAAFTLASMVREREEALVAAGVLIRKTLTLTRPEDRWYFAAAGVGAIDLTGAAPGGGLAVFFGREWGGAFRVGLGADFEVHAAPASLLLQPTLFGEFGFSVPLDRWRPAIRVGGGVMPSVFLREGATVTAWLPILRVAVEARYLIGEHHGLSLTAGAHLAPQTVALQAAQPLGAVGPAWPRIEAGYFVEW